MCQHELLFKETAGQTEMNCIICGKEGDGDFCGLHAVAYANIIKHYPRWKRALGLSWKEYLSEIVENSSTGEWARRMAQHLMKTGESPRVKNG